jgi:excisionase family DNA binding protein
MLNKEPAVAPDKSYLTIQEVASRLGVNVTTVYRLAQKGKLPAFKVGSQWRFSGDQLESWVADQVTLEWLKAENRARSVESSGRSQS